MKSFIWEIESHHMPMHPYAKDIRVKAYYEGNNFVAIQHDPDLLLMGINWFAVYTEILNEIRERYRCDLASVDLTPADHCQHSDDVQDV